MLISKAFMPDSIWRGTTGAMNRNMAESRWDGGSYVIDFTVGQSFGE